MTTLLYDAALAGYRAAIRLVAPFLPKAKKFVAGRDGLLPRIEAALANEPRECVWMHCASLGEFEQGRPVLEQLRQQHPECAFILTFFSPSGYDVRKGYDGADYVFYLPEDTRSNARRFVAAVRPKLALFVKYDLWLHLLTALRAQNVPAVLFAARFQQTQGFFRWYGGVQRTMLGLLDRIFVQDAASEALLHQIGIRHTAVAGDTRFDRVAEAAEQPPIGMPPLEAFANGARLLIAGSTWPEDETLLAEVPLPKGWKLVLVPHEVDEAHLQQIETLFVERVARWGTPGAAALPVLLVDRVGLLLQLYRRASLAYVGGGFGRAGVHNVLEPAAFGVPVIHGPVYHQFLEAAALRAAGGAVVVHDGATLEAALWTFTENETARLAAGGSAAQYVQAGRGATGRICDYLEAKYWLMTL